VLQVKSEIFPKTEELKTNLARAEEILKPYLVSKVSPRDNAVPEKVPDSSKKSSMPPANPISGNEKPSQNPNNGEQNVPRKQKDKQGSILKYLTGKIASSACIPAEIEAKSNVDNLRGDPC
jgi:hypothetical protein